MSSDPSSGIDLITAVSKNVEQVRTKSLDISFNELADMYESSELIIDPEYQRMFRWPLGKRSRFIESLILEMPIPPIFVIEIADGKYELIDGLQRIATYLSFRGLLKGEEGIPYPPLILEDCDIVKELNGHTFETLPASLKIRLKRVFVRVEVLRKESDQRLKYYMFKRLNTGGEILTDQEVRNCTIRLLSPVFNNFIIELSKNEDFRTCIIAEDREEKKIDQELVLKFFAFKNYRQNYKHEVADFLTEYMEMISDPQTHLLFDYQNERQIFERTFKILALALGDTAFGRFNKRYGQIQSGFMAYHYEALALGIQPILDKVHPGTEDDINILRDYLIKIKSDPLFIDITSGGGKNYFRLLEERISFVSSRLVSAYGNSNVG